MNDSNSPPRPAADATDPKQHRAPVISSEQRALIEEMERTAPTEGRFSITRDDAAGLFVAAKDDVEFGGVLFAESDGQVLLLSTSILPAFRGQGLATELTRRVLNLLRAEGKSVTVRCPVFRSFLQHYPEYEQPLHERPESDRNEDG